MADDENDGRGSSSQGTDWEVVNLTASTYAAAPGPGGFHPSDEPSEKEFKEHQQESSSAMFMSDHFVFPPEERKNFVVEPDYSEVLNQSGNNLMFTGDDVDGYNKYNEESGKSKCDDGLLGIQDLDKGKDLSLHGTDFGEGKAFESLVKEEEIMFIASGFSALHAETDFGLPPCENSMQSSGPEDSSNELLGSSEFTKTSDVNDENKLDGSDLPFEAWWKRHIVKWYSHAKDANTFWSLFVAAALMGLGILGQRWQQENLQFQQLKWQFTLNVENMNWVVGPIHRFKEVIAGGHPRIMLTRGASTMDNQDF